MKLLLDTCVWGGAKVELLVAGHDTLWTGDLAQDPGDEDILAQAHREQRVLITLDKDFGELAIRRALAHSGIMRLVNIAARQQATVCQQVLGLYGGELAQGAIVTVEAGLSRVETQLHSERGGVGFPQPCPRHGIANRLSRICSHIRTRHIMYFPHC